MSMAIRGQTMIYTVGLASMGRSIRATSREQRRGIAEMCFWDIGIDRPVQEELEIGEIQEAS